MTVIEKILASHAGKAKVQPGDIVNVEIDCRAARDFGGANVVEHLLANNLPVENVDKTILHLTAIREVQIKSMQPINILQTLCP